jgi:hypothetical protein
VAAVAALASFLWLAGAAAASPSDSGVSAPQTVVRVVLTTPDDGPTRTYRATAFDRSGRAVEGAVLDIGGMSNDPDLRVATTPMRAISSTSSQATITYPAPGHWVVVVRVHHPSTYVHLGSEEVTGVAEPAAAHETPSRIALERISPNLGARLTAIQNGSAVAPSATHDPSGAWVAASDEHSGAPLLGVSSGSLVGDLGYSLLHLVGAGAWLVAVIAVALSNWAGMTPLGHNLRVWVAPRYSMLAGGGLVVVAVTGISNLQRSAPEGLVDGTILNSSPGRVYVGALACKLGLVAASVITSIRLGSRLRQEGVGELAMVPDRSGLVGVGRVDAINQRLAVRNVLFAAMIVGCVNVMSQAHHFLH